METPQFEEILKDGTTNLTTIEDSVNLLEPGAYTALGLLRELEEEINDYAGFNFGTRDVLAINHLAADPDLFDRQCPFRKLAYIKGTKIQYVQPCGKCLYCTQKKTYKMLSRLLIEKNRCKQTYFSTLTFDNDHITTYDPSIINRLIKSLRYAGFDLKYRGITEYGPKTFRLHCHVLFLIKDYPLNKSFLDTLQQAWRYGFVSITPPTSNHLCYLAGYEKKLFTRTPSHVQQSTKPPIGYIEPDEYDILDSYYTDNLHRIDNVPVIPTRRDLIKYEITTEEEYTDKVCRSMVQDYTPLSMQELEQYKHDLQQAYNKFQKNKLSIDRY